MTMSRNEKRKMKHAARGEQTPVTNPVAITERRKAGMGAGAAYYSGAEVIANARRKPILTTRRGDWAVGTRLARRAAGYAA